MALTKEELAQIMREVQSTTTEARATDQAEITRLNTENEGLRSAATAAQNRPALYGPDGQSVISGARMSKEEKRAHVIQRLGNAARAIALSKQSGGSLRDAAEIAEKRYGDKATGEAIIRSLSEGVAGDGGNLVETQYAPEMIELLYATAVVRSAGARVLPMPGGNLTVHRLATGVTGRYEGELNNIAVQQETTDSVQMTAKQLSVIVPVSNQLLQDTSGLVNDMVVSDIGSGLSLREDLAFLRGDGTSNTPVGVRNQAAVANVVTAISLAGALSKGRALLRGANLPLRKRGIIMNADLESYFYSYLSKNGDYVYRDEMDGGKLMGMPFYVTTQIPSNLTTGGMTAGTEMYFGEWSEVIIGETMAVNIETSTEGSYFNGTTLVSAFSTNQTLFRAIGRHDIALRHRQGIAIVLIDLATVPQAA
ncbi:phage major capsid protein [Deinococcus altitudinis]|uniref:phage major capsid protein n=1 Tax=Deinococcus altitudinis TaxID=468914 RepID=UPI003892C129